MERPANCGLCGKTICARSCSICWCPVGSGIFCRALTLCVLLLQGAHAESGGNRDFGCWFRARRAELASPLIEAGRRDADHRATGHACWRTVSSAAKASTGTETRVPSLARKTTNFALLPRTTTGKKADDTTRLVDDFE
jgi:hypothetical protein